MRDAAECVAPIRNAVTSALDDRIPEMMAPAVSRWPPFELINKWILSFSPAFINRDISSLYLFGSSIVESRNTSCVLYTDSIVLICTLFSSPPNKLGTFSSASFTIINSFFYKIYDSRLLLLRVRFSTEALLLLCERTWHLLLHLLSFHNSYKHM